MQGLNRTGVSLLRVCLCQKFTAPGASHGHSLSKIPKSAYTLGNGVFEAARVARTKPGGLWSMYLPLKHIHVYYFLH